MWVNTIDYSSLNRSLKPKSPALTLKDNIVEEIWKVFLQTNNLSVDNNLNKGKVERRNSSINEFASNIEAASEWVKTEFILTVDYLVTHKLLNSEKIRSLKLRQLKWEWTADEKLNKIMDEFKSSLSEKDRLALDKNVAEWIINLSKENKKADELWEEVNELKQENNDLQTENAALEVGFENMVKDATSRWSFSNIKRLTNAIIKIKLEGEGKWKKKEKLSQEEVTRRILWQADKFVFWWGTKSKRVFKSFKRMDVNEQYNRIHDKLDKMKATAKPSELPFIKYIQDEVNKAHTNYINEISMKTKKLNARKFNEAMLSAA